MYYNRNEKTFQRSKINTVIFVDACPLAGLQFWKSKLPVTLIVITVGSVFSYPLVVCSRKTTDIALWQIGVMTSCVVEYTNLILPEKYLSLAGEHFRNLVDYLHGFGSRLLFKNLYIMGNPLRDQKTSCTAYSVVSSGQMTSDMIYDATVQRRVTVQICSYRPIRTPRSTQSLSTPPHK